MAILGTRKAKTRTTLLGSQYIRSPRSNTMVKGNRANQQMNARQRAAREARQDAVRQAYRANIRTGASVKAMATAQTDRPLKTANSWDRTRSLFKANKR